MTKPEKKALLERAIKIDEYIKGHIHYYPATFFQNLDERFGHGHTWRIIRSKMAERRSVTEQDLWWVESGEDIIGLHRKYKLRK